MDIAGKKLLSNIASLSIVQIANYVFPLITVPIISRIIGPANLGILNYATTFVGYFVLFISFGFDLTATRKLSQNPNNTNLRNEVFSKVFQSQLYLLGIGTLIFVSSIVFLKPMQADLRVTFFSFLFVIGTVFTQNWLFQAMQELKKIALFNFLGKLIFSSTILLLIHKKEDYFLQALMISVANIIVSLISFIWAIKKYNLKLTFYPFKTIISFLKTESMVFLSKAAVSLYTTTNVVMLGFLESPTNIGYYTAALNLILIVSQVINMPLSTACYPYIGKSFGINKNEGLESVKKIAPLILCFTFLSSILLMLFGPIVITLFYGKKFSPSILIFRIISIMPFIWSIGNLFGTQILLNLKYDRVALKITITGGVLCIISNYIFTKAMGYVGTAINWVLIETFLAFLTFYYTHKLKLNPLKWTSFNFPLIFKDLLKNGN